MSYKSYWADFGKQKNACARCELDVQRDDAAAQQLPVGRVVKCGTTTEMTKLSPPIAPQPTTTPFRQTRGLERYVGLAIAPRRQRA